MTDIIPTLREAADHMHAQNCHHTARLLRGEADRLDREAARDAEVEPLAIKIGGVFNDSVIWNGLTEYERDTYRRAARAAIQHLQPIAAWLVAEAAWKTALALPTELPGLGRAKDDEWCQHPEYLRSPFCPPAENPVSA